jgi:hypothetical protein
MLRASSGVIAAGVEALGQTQGELGEELPQGGARVELMASLHGVLDQAQADVLREGADIGPSQGLIQPLADARDELTEHLDDVADQLSRANRTVFALQSFLDGDGRYLVLAANNAEM